MNDKTQAAELPVLTSEQVGAIFAITDLPDHATSENCETARAVFIGNLNGLSTQHVDMWRAGFMAGVALATAGAQPAVETHWNTPGSKHPERLFAEWLNEYRMSDVSSVFHEIVHRYRTALAIPQVAQQKQLQPLSDEKIKLIYHSSHWWELGNYPFTWGAAAVVIRAAEAAHGITAKGS